MVMFRMSTKLTNLFNYVKTQGKNQKAYQEKTSFFEKICDSCSLLHVKPYDLRLYAKRIYACNTAGVLKILG